MEWNKDDFYLRNLKISTDYFLNMKYGIINIQMLKHFRKAVDLCS